jgi:AAA domain
MPPTGAARKATVQRARLRAAFSGPSKSGKSYISLVIMDSLIKTLQEHDSLRGNGRFVVIDSEGGRGDDYGDLFDYDVYDLANFSPEAYIDAIRIFVGEGYSGIIIDQISHEWDGKGGALEINHNLTRQSSSKNSWAAWGDTTPRHQAFIETLVRCPTHLICTMRVKTDWDRQTNERGKIEPVKIGLSPVQRNSTEYEFDIFGTIDQNHNVKMECRGMLSELLGDKTFLPGKNIRDPGEVGAIGPLVGKWISGRASAESLGWISREQVEEIQAFGDKLGWDHSMWKKFFSHLSISSISRMTPEMYNVEKAKLSHAISVVESKTRERSEKSEKSQQI